MTSSALLFYPIFLSITCDTCCAGVDSSLHNYVLLGLALFQFPFMYYLGIRPSAVVALKPK